MTNAPLAILPDRYEGTRVLELRLSKAATGDGRILRLVERFEPGNQPGRTAKGGQTNSFVLMGDIQSMKWAVWDPRSQQEMGEWDQPVKPSYLKLELVRKDGARSLTNVGIFWPKGGILRKPGLAVIEFLPPIAPGQPVGDFMATIEASVETASNALMREAGLAV